MIGDEKWTPVDVKNLRSLDGGATTLIEQAYEVLRRDIVSGKLGPGTKLQTENLKKDYGFKSSTLREALTRLTGDTLATQQGQRGFRVAPISREDFADLCDVRKTIEVDALRRSIQAGDDRWEAGVVAAFHRLAKVEARMPDELESIVDEWEERNRAFHRALLAACPSTWLLRIHDQLFQQAERYRRITFASGRVVPRNVHQEHKAIMEAAIARDVDAACGLSASHIQKTLTVLDIIDRLTKNTE